MTDRLAEIKAQLRDGPLQLGSGQRIEGAPNLDEDDADWLVGEVERLQRFEAMWEDACRHRDTAEARARGYQDRLRAIEALVCPGGEPL